MPRTIDNGRCFIGGVEVQRGSVVKDFRGESWVLRDWYLPGQAASRSRVELAEAGQATGCLYYTSVIDAKLVAPDGEEHSS